MRTLRLVEAVYVECSVRVPPTEVSPIAGQTGRECKMAHSCRWRFPARPGGSSNSGTGRRAGRIRVTASLRSVSGAHPNAAGLGPGFDAALQVSSVIGSNLQKFRDVLGESSDSSSTEVRTGMTREHRLDSCGARVHAEDRWLHVRQGANGYCTQTLTIFPSPWRLVWLWANLSLPRCSVNFELVMWP